MSDVSATTPFVEPHGVTESHRVDGELSEVTRLNRRLTELWAERELPPEHEAIATLALEEMLSNVIRHSSASEISVRFTISSSAVEFEISDNGAPFDPLEAPALDPASPLEARRAGGMGIHIVRSYADELRYEYHAGRNTLVFRKSW